MWMREAGGGFDIILDPQWTGLSDPLARLTAFWNTLLKPGGQYILEDVSNVTVVNALQDWMEWIVIRATTCRWMPPRRVKAIHRNETRICWGRNQGLQRTHAMQETLHEPPVDLMYIVALKQRSILLRKAVSSGHYAAEVRAYWGDWGESHRPWHTASRLPPAMAPEDECIADFVATANRSKRVTDKITTHMYQVLYGAQLCNRPPVPFTASQRTLSAPLWQTPSKFLEIGLGCDMQYGPGASVRLWSALFPSTRERWEAEYDKKCVRASQARGELDHVRVLVGDQGDNKTLERWKAEAGGAFDVIIDDGGHKNKQIALTFAALWPRLSQGGIYFIEDIQLGRTVTYENTDAGAITADWLAILAAELILGRDSAAAMPSVPEAPCKSFNVPTACVSVQGGRRRADTRLFQPPDANEVDYVFCSLEACSVAKALLQ